MEYSLLQKKLWKIGGYKVFALKHCPILYNEIAGIGALFTFQLIIVFFSTIAFSSVFKIDWLLFGIPLGIINVLIFNFWSKLLLKFIHRYLNWGALILICLLKSIFSLIISLPFILFLFESQALYQLLLIKGKINLGFWEQFSLKPYGLYLSWFSESEGTIILIFSFAIFIMVLFISIAPYFLIVKGRKSIYNLVITYFNKMKFQGVRTLLLYSSAFILLSFMLSSCNQGVNQIQLLPNEYRDSILNERKNTLEMYLNNEYELIRSSISSYHDSLVTINQKISLIIKEDSFKNSLNPLISPKELKINKDIRVSLLQKIDSLRLRQFELHTKTESELKIIGHYYSAFPVDDIKLCLNDTLNRNDFINHLDCPICGRKSDKLLWINFRSPDYTWKNMMGREGPLSICETCKVQIEFIPYIMN